MLFSRNKKFIFIHAYKTAGTSIKSALIPHLGSKQFVFLAKLLKKCGLSIQKFDYSPYQSHITASELVNEMGKDTFNSFFSFAFVRNPWDWQVSFYKYMLKNEDHYQHNLIKQMSGFEEYIHWRCNNVVKYQKDFLYSADEELLVDFVGRFENLDKDFKKICDRLEISAKLTKKNVSNSTPYQQYYNKETKELVRKTFEPDISLFEYEFNGSISLNLD